MLSDPCAVVRQSGNNATYDKIDSKELFGGLKKGGLLGWAYVDHLSTGAPPAPTPGAFHELRLNIHNIASYSGQHGSSDLSRPRRSVLKVLLVLLKSKIVVTKIIIPWLVPDSGSPVVLDKTEYNY